MENFLKQQYNHMLEMIKTLVNTDSGTLQKTGVDKVGSFLKEAFESIGFLVKEMKQKEAGNHLLVHHPEAVNPEILLLAHMDTVFPEGTAKERPFTIRDGKAFGPGVIDMKASLVSVFYAVQALLNHDDPACRNIEILFTSDEETGSATSRSLIEQQTADKKYALVLEPARKDGSLVSGRKGTGRYRVAVEGKAAHSGIEPEKGRSAIAELAYKIIQIHEMSDPTLGIAVNVGMIEGGSALNTVSDYAAAQVEVRAAEAEQIAWVEKKMMAICSVTEVEGTKVLLEGEINRPPMEKNEETEALLHIIETVGQKIGMEIKDTATGGGSDASFTSALGIATVDGLGPVGGNPHSEKEYLELSSLIPRTWLLARIIKALTEQTKK